MQGFFSPEDLERLLYLRQNQRALSQTPINPAIVDRLYQQQAVRQVAEALKANPDIDILVEGHTDSDGSADANWNLSVSRAVAVTNLLSSFGVNPEKITAAGRGEYQPKADNSTSAGKAKNRRTEIILAPKLDELYEFLSGE